MNDVFYPISRNIDNYRIQIFNSWGEKLFESRDASKAGGWDGMYKGKVVESGVYVYMIEYRYEEAGRMKDEYISGVVHVLQ